MQEYKWLSTDEYYLKWLAERLVSVYKESPNTDFVKRLSRIANRFYGDGYREPLDI